MRRLTRGSVRSHTPSIPSSLLPSVVFCRHKDGEMKLPVVSTASRKRTIRCTALIQVHPPTPPSSPPFLSPVIHSWNKHTHMHTQTYTLPHTLTHVSPILQPHTSSRTVTTRNERLKPRQPDSVLTLLAPPLPAEGGGERGTQRGEGEKERGVTHDLHGYT